ncbi:MAG: DUF222 domain-containing protein [Candidatus Nanopelagicaceae bacterium]|nr:DUF222 domain-containing protein [Candidatus Nanopelagicaceae bacterium]
MTSGILKESTSKYSVEKSHVIDESEGSKIAQLLHQTPGIRVLAEILDIDPFALSQSERIDYLAALERQTSWLQAAMQRAIVAVAGDEPSRTDDLWGGVDEAEREDVATALRLSGSTAQSRIDIARTLVNHLPNTCSALSTGEISPSHATVIARETASAIRDGLSPLAIHIIEEKALSHAEFHTPSQVANKVRSTLAKFAPEDFENAVTAARDTRRISCYRESNGMSTIVAILPAEDAQLVMSAIESFVLLESKDANSAVNHADDVILDSEFALERDGRSMDMKRADALTSIAAWILAQETSDVRQHRRPITINVTVDLPTLMGLTENPGQLAGYGAIPASLARTLAAEGKWRRFITDPITGALLDFGRESYEPPQALVDFLLARDRTCRFPGCRAPARSGDLDHAQSWESGGETTVQNLGALCRRHHRLKTHGGWQLKSEMDGSCLWTSPHGKQYTVPARDIQEAV